MSEEEGGHAEGEEHEAPGGLVSTILGRAGQAGDILGGGLFGALPGMVGAAREGGSLLNGAVEGLETVGHGGSALGSVGKVLGPLGIGLSAASTGWNAARTADRISELGPAAAYHDQETYNLAGETALGAAHTVLPFLGPYGEAANLALSGAEVAADAGGAAAAWGFGKDAGFSASSVAGGLIRGTFGDQSLGDQARQGVQGLVGHGTFGNIVGGATQMLTNSAMLPANLAMTAGRGIVNEGRAIFNGIANGEGAIGGALNHGAHMAVDGARALGGMAVNGAQTLGRGAQALGGMAMNGLSTIGHGAQNLANGAINGAGNLANSAINGASNLAHGAVNGASNLAHGAVNGISNGISAVAHW